MLLGERNEFSAERSSFYLGKIVGSIIPAVTRFGGRAFVLRGERVNDWRCSCAFVRCAISRFLRNFERQKYIWRTASLRPGGRTFSSG